MKLHLENVNTVTKRLKSGRIAEYHYHRKTGKRIVGEPGTREFLDSYEAAGIAEERNSETLNSLIQAYQGSIEFQRLAPSSRYRYRHLLQRISDRWGKHELEVFADRRVKADILAWRDEIAKSGTLAVAQHTIATMKTLFNWGEQRGLIEVNRLRNIESIYRPNRKDCVWDEERIRTLFDAAAPEIVWSACLALFTLQRQGDLLRLRWPAQDQMELRVKQQKTLAPVIIPIVGGLQEVLGGIPQRADCILTNTRKAPWTLDGFKRTWRDTVAKAGLEGENLHFHDLRGTAITALADQGATEAEIAALSGHTLPGQNAAMKGYLSRTATQARNAMAKLQASWIGQLPTIAQTALLTA